MNTKKSVSKNGSTATTASDHVTGNNPESVVIVALGPTSADWHAENCPYDRAMPQADEVWTLNKGIRHIRCDVAFVMDDMVGEGRKSEQYRRDLDACSAPIITSIVDDDVRAMYPNAVIHRYPLAHVLWSVGFAVERARGKAIERITDQDCVRNGVAMRYFQNSVPYMLAYAWFIGVKRLRLYGADYTFPNQPAREDDRANCEYWVGIVRALGMEVSLPDTTTLLDTRYQKGLYGFGARQPLVKPPTVDDLARYAARYGYGANTQG